MEHVGIILWVSPTDACHSWLASVGQSTFENKTDVPQTGVSVMGNLYAKT